MYCCLHSSKSPCLTVAHPHAARYELRCPPPGATPAGLAAFGAAASGASVLPGANCLALATSGSVGSSGKGPCGGAAAAGPKAAASGNAGLIWAAGGARRGADATAAFVGTEGGALLRCHLAGTDSSSGGGGGAVGGGSGAGAAAAAAGEARFEFRHPVREAGYERAAGAVTGVAVSPFQVGVTISHCQNGGRSRLRSTSQGGRADAGTPTPFKPPTPF
jgi:hypothetical protein